MVRSVRITFHRVDRVQEPPQTEEHVTYQRARTLLLVYDLLDELQHMLDALYNHIKWTRYLNLFDVFPLKHMSENRLVQYSNLYLRSFSVKLSM